MKNKAADIEQVLREEGFNPLSVRILANGSPEVVMASGDAAPAQVRAEQVSVAWSEEEPQPSKQTMIEAICGNADARSAVEAYEQRRLARAQSMRAAPKG